MFPVKLNYDVYYKVVIDPWDSCFVLRVCVDVFVTTQTYVDIASISAIPRTTGGQVNMNFYGSVVEVNDLGISLHWFLFEMN